MAATKENMVRWGMIGCGDVTERKSAPSFNKVPGSKLVAVGSRTPGKARDFAHRHAIPNFHTSPDGVIGDPEVDIIYVATPPGSHAAWALDCIGAGKPVYIEKPMARRWEECHMVNEAAEKAGVPVYVAYYRRSLEYFNIVKQIIGSGRLGKILQADLLQHFAARKEDFDRDNLPWRVIPEISGGGYFHDMGCHALDIIFHMLGDPVRVSGETLNRGGLYEAADTVGALLTLPGNVLLTGSWSFVTPGTFQKDRVTVTGEKGLMEFSIFSFDPIHVRAGGATETFATEQPEHIQMPFIRSIVDELNGGDACPSTGRTGAVTSLVMDQITGIR